MWKESQPLEPAARYTRDLMAPDLLQAVQNINIVVEQHKIGNLFRENFHLDPHNFLQRINNFHCTNYLVFSLSLHFLITCFLFHNNVPWDYYTDFTFILFPSLLLLSLKRFPLAYWSVRLAIVWLCSRSSLYKLFQVY